MRRFKELLEKRWFAYSVATCSAVLLYLVLTHIPVILSGFRYFYGFLRPIVIGLVIAYIINPLVKLYEHIFFGDTARQGIARSVSVLLALASVIIFIVILMIALVPQLIDSAKNLISNLDNYAASLELMLENLDERFPAIDITQFTEDGIAFLHSIPDKLPKDPAAIFSTTYSIGSGMVTGILGFILAIYFLLDKGRLQDGFKRLMKALMSEKRYERSGKFWIRCNTILLRYIGGDLLDGVIVGAVNLVFMIVMGMPYAVLISVIVGITNLAPTFGPVFGGALGAFILVLVKPWDALWFLVFTVVLQIVDGYIIKPKLFGNTLGVPSVWILISIIVFGRMFGVTGIMLAIPFAAIIVYFYDEILLQRLESRKKQ